MSDNYETLILRFRDLVTTEPGRGTIQQHKAIIEKFGYVWWAWWKKGQEMIPVNQFAVLGTRAEENPIIIYLFDSAQKLVYKAKCNCIKRSEKLIDSPDEEKTPEYYRFQQYYAWFRFTEIEACKEDEINKLSYVYIESLSNNEDEDYSKFNEKKVSSIEELIKQNKTIWFVRKATDSDSGYELLLKTEDEEPRNFSKKFYQANGDTILWLSDLHLSNSNFLIREDTPVRKTLTEHLRNCVNDFKDIAGIFISGDITWQAQKEGFKKAEMLLDDIRHDMDMLTKLKPENTVICPGNHDFCRINKILERNDEIERVDKDPYTAKFYSEFYESIYKISPNKFFSCGKKILLKSGHAIEVVSLNSLILQQYTNFESHGFISQPQLDFVTKEMGWEENTDNRKIRIVMMHHHYLPTCHVEQINVGRASSVVYDADRLMKWLIKYNVRLLLHGHKHKSFISQIEYPFDSNSASITEEHMKKIAVVGMGGTGSMNTENKFSTIKFTGKNIEIQFFQIYSDESNSGKPCQKFIIPIE